MTQLMPVHTNAEIRSPSAPGGVTDCEDEWHDLVIHTERCSAFLLIYQVSLTHSLLIDPVLFSRAYCIKALSLATIRSTESSGNFPHFRKFCQLDFWRGFLTGGHVRFQLTDHRLVGAG